MKGDTLILDNKSKEIVFKLLTEGKREKSLEYSEYATWTKPGDLSTTLINTGDGYIFHDHFSEVVFEFDYSQMNSLCILLKLFNLNADITILKEK